MANILLYCYKQKTEKEKEQRVYVHGPVNVSFYTIHFISLIMF